MSIEGIRTVSSYGAVQQSASAASATTVAATAIKTASVADTVKKTTIHEGAEENSPKQNETAPKAASVAELQKTVERLNNEMSVTECRYRMHEGTNRVMISIVDKETKEVIKEFPVEEALDRISKALELAGLIVDKKL